MNFRYIHGWPGIKVDFSQKTLYFMSTDRDERCFQPKIPSNSWEVQLNTTLGMKWGSKAGNEIARFMGVKSKCLSFTIKNQAVDLEVRPERGDPDWYVRQLPNGYTLRAQARNGEIKLRVFGRWNNYIGERHVYSLERKHRLGEP